MSEASVMKVERDHVSREDLRSMTVGQVVEFVLPEPGKIESARQTRQQLKLYRYKFDFKPNPERCSVTITCLEKPMNIQ